MRVFFTDQSVEITNVSSFYLRRWTCGFALCRVLEGAHYRVRPRRASVFACVVLTGTSKGLVGPRVLVWTRC